MCIAPRSCNCDTVAVRSSSNGLTLGRAACPAPPGGNPVPRWLRGRPSLPCSEDPTPNTIQNTRAHTGTHGALRARLLEDEGP